MNELTRRCKAADLAHAWHPFTQHAFWDEDEIVVIERGEGCFLYDTEGGKYLDGVSSLWVNPHGHRRAEIDAAVKGQLERIAHSTFLGLSNVPASLLARELAEAAPEGLKRVFYSDSGAEAVEIALKMAFQYHKQNGAPERDTFLALGDAYHGDTLGSVSVGGISLFHSIYEPLLFDVVRVPSPYCYRCPWGRERGSCSRECFTALERAFERYGPKLAAAVVEPRIQGAAGMIVHPPGYLKKMEELCRRHGTFLIADEVATGFYRTGELFSCMGEDVRPDFLCLGKGITGGYLPLAATLTTEEVFEGFLGDADSGRAFYHGHSYTGNQLAAAAARASLALFREEGKGERINGLAARFAEGLEKFTELPHVGDVRVLGMMAGVELVRDRESKEPWPARDRTGHRVIRAARERGVILRPLGDVIVLMPPLCISEAELDRLLSVTYNSVIAVTGK